MELSLISSDVFSSSQVVADEETAVEDTAAEEDVAVEDEAGVVEDTAVEVSRPSFSLCIHCWSIADPTPRNSLQYSLDSRYLYRSLRRAGVSPIPLDPLDDSSFLSRLPSPLPVFLSYADFQISGGVGGDATAEAEADFVSESPRRTVTTDATTKTRLIRSSPSFQLPLPTPTSPPSLPPISSLFKPCERLPRPLSSTSMLLSRLLWV